MTAQLPHAQLEDAPAKTITHNRIHNVGRSPRTEPCQEPNQDAKDHKTITRFMLMNINLLSN